MKGAISSYDCVRHQYNIIIKVDKSTTYTKTETDTALSTQIKTSSQSLAISTINLSYLSYNESSGLNKLALTKGVNLEFRDKHYVALCSANSSDGVNMCRIVNN